MSTYLFGDDAEALGRYAWYKDNSGRITHPVGQKEPNAWGLYDMHGNVCEWVQDWYGDYSGSSATDPQGPSSGSCRVVRGGAWRNSAMRCRSVYRLYFTPGNRRNNLGFRLAFSPGQ
jgi:formylglycine-generating enzyme required for sulfatase activity